MCAADAMAARGRRFAALLDPATNSCKRQRWSVDEVAGALGRCDLGGAKSNTCTTLGAWCPPGRTPRLVRYAKRQAERRERRQLMARQRCREHVEVHTLETMLGAALLTSE